MSGTSPTLLLVLHRLGRTDGRTLLKGAVKELVARDVLRAETAEPRVGLRRRTRVFLSDGPASAPPSRALQVALRHVQATPSKVRDGRVARELSVVARHLARGGARREVLAAAILDLTGMGLVHEEERRTLGLFRRRVVVRTPGGDELLRTVQRRRARRAEGGPDPVVVGLAADAGSGTGHVPDLDERSDAAPDGGFDGLFDGAFDQSFYAAFDSSFDAAFDSGFSDGGGGGGDGDGDGGGGDDGGGGGG